MTRFHLAWLIGLSFAALQVSHVGAQYPPFRRANAPDQASPALVCKVHALSDLGDDPNLCKWIADTIPAVIQPGTWNQSSETAAPGQCAVRFYAPAKILVVSHTAAVQVQVDAFLDKVKKSLPAKTAKAPTPETGIMQASYAAPMPVKRAEPAAVAPLSYPVPASTKSPKHLFHFIIRYEGEGVIDSNIVNFTKALQGAGASAVVREMPYTSPPTTAMPQGPVPERIGVDFNQPASAPTVLPPAPMSPPATILAPLPTLPRGVLNPATNVAPMPSVVAY